MKLSEAYTVLGIPESTARRDLEAARKAKLKEAQKLDSAAREGYLSRVHEAYQLIQEQLQGTVTVVAMPFQSGLPTEADSTALVPHTTLNLEQNLLTAGCVGAALLTLALENKDYVPIILNSPELSRRLCENDYFCDNPTKLVEKYPEVASTLGKHIIQAYVSTKEPWFAIANNWPSLMKLAKASEALSIIFLKDPNALKTLKEGGNFFYQFLNERPPLLEILDRGTKHDYQKRTQEKKENASKASLEFLTRLKKSELIEYAKASENNALQVLKEQALRKTLNVYGMLSIIKEFPQPACDKQFDLVACLIELLSESSYSLSGENSPAIVRFMGISATIKQQILSSPALLNYLNLEDIARLQLDEGLLSEEKTAVFKIHKALFSKKDIDYSVLGHKAFTCRDLYCFALAFVDVAKYLLGNPDLRKKLLQNDYVGVWRYEISDKHRDHTSLLDLMIDNPDIDEWVANHYFNKLLERSPYVCRRVIENPPLLQKLSSQGKLAVVKRIPQLFQNLILQSGAIFNFNAFPVEVWIFLTNNEVVLNPDIARMLSGQPKIISALLSHCNLEKYTAYVASGGNSEERVIAQPSRSQDDIEYDNANSLLGKLGSEVIAINILFNLAENGYEQSAVKLKQLWADNKYKPHLLACYDTERREACVKRILSDQPLTPETRLAMQQLHQSVGVQLEQHGVPPSLLLQQLVFLPGIKVSIDSCLIREALMDWQVVLAKAVKSVLKQQLIEHSEVKPWLDILNNEQHVLLNLVRLSQILPGNKLYTHWRIHLLGLFLSECLKNYQPYDLQNHSVVAHQMSQNFKVLASEEDNVSVVASRLKGQKNRKHWAAELYVTAAYHGDKPACEAIQKIFNAGEKDLADKILGYYQLLLSQGSISLFQGFDLYEFMSRTGDSEERKAIGERLLENKVIPPDLLEYFILKILAYSPEERLGLVVHYPKLTMHLGFFALAKAIKQGDKKAIYHLMRLGVPLLGASIVAYGDLSKDMRDYIDGQFSALRSWRSQELKKATYTQFFKNLYEGIEIYLKDRLPKRIAHKDFLFDPVINISGSSAESVVKVALRIVPELGKLDRDGYTKLFL